MRRRLIEEFGGAIAVRHTEKDFPEEIARENANQRHNLVVERVEAQTTLVVSNTRISLTPKKRPRLCLAVFVDKIEPVPPEFRPLAVCDTLYTASSQIPFDTGTPPGRDTPLDRMVAILRRVAGSKSQDWMTEAWMSPLTNEALMAVTLISADFPDFMVVLRDETTVYVPQALLPSAKIALFYRFMYETGSELVSELHPCRDVRVDYAKTSLLYFDELDKVQSASGLADILNRLSRLPVSARFRTRSSGGITIFASPNALSLDRGVYLAKKTALVINCDTIELVTSGGRDDEKNFYLLKYPPLMDGQVEASMFTGVQLILRVVALFKLAEILSGRPRITQDILDEVMQKSPLGESIPIRLKQPFRPRAPIEIKIRPRDRLPFVRKGLKKTLRDPLAPLLLDIPPPISFVDSFFLVPVCWMGRYGGEFDQMVTTLPKSPETFPRLCDTVFALGERLMCVISQSLTSLDVRTIGYLWWKARALYAAKPEFYTLTTAKDVADIDTHISVLYSGNADLHEMTNERNRPIFAALSPLIVSDNDMSMYPVDPWIARCVRARTTQDVYEKRYVQKLALFEFEGKEHAPLSNVSFDRFFVPKERIPHESVRGVDTVAMLLIDMAVRDWDRHPDSVFQALQTLPFLADLDWHFPTAEGIKAEIQDNVALWLTFPKASQARAYAREVEERLRTPSDFIRIGRTVVAILVYGRQISVRIAFESEDEQPEAGSKEKKSGTKKE